MKSESFVRRYLVLFDFWILGVLELYALAEELGSMGVRTTAIVGMIRTIV